MFPGEQVYKAASEKPYIWSWLCDAIKKNYSLTNNKEPCENKYLFIANLLYHIFWERTLFQLETAFEMFMILQLKETEDHFFIICF